MSFITPLNCFGGFSQYYVNEIVFEQGNPGSYPFHIKQSGTFYLEMVGGGGGGSNSGGGTGSVFLGNIFMPVGNYQFLIGKGGHNGNRNNDAADGTQTSIAGVITCGGGFRGYSNRTARPPRISQGGDFIISNPNMILQPQNGKNGLVGFINNNEGIQRKSEFIPNPSLGEGGKWNRASNPGAGGDGGNGFLRLTYKSRLIIR